MAYQFFKDCLNRLGERIRGVPALIRAAYANKLAKAQKLLVKALAWAVHYQRRKMVVILLALGADPNCEAFYGGWTVLINAAYDGNPHIVKALVHKGAEIDRPYGKPQFTALMYSVQEAAQWTPKYSEYLGVVKILLEAGADPDLQDDMGWTALMKASANGHVEIIKALLAYKADSNLQNDQGETAYMYAYRQGYKDVVKLLLNHGVDPTIATSFGYTVSSFTPRVLH